MSSKKALYTETEQARIHLIRLYGNYPVIDIYVKTGTDHVTGAVVRYPTKVVALDRSQVL